MRSLLVASLLFLVACDPFAAAQKEDSIEGWEQFIEANPASPWLPQAKDRLELLVFEQAKEQNTLPAYDAWLERFPRSRMRDEVIDAREGSLYAWAEAQDTTEAWDVFLSEYDNSRRKTTAQRHRRAAEHRPNLRIDNPRSSRTNLAEDPEGPLNGWLLEADVTNTGEVALSRVILSPKEPAALDTLEWPVAARTWTLPLTEAQQQPLRAGETRTWSWTTDDLPEDWSGTLGLVLVDAAP